MQLGVQLSAQLYVQLGVQLSAQHSVQLYVQLYVQLSVQLGTCPQCLNRKITSAILSFKQLNTKYLAYYLDNNLYNCYTRPMNAHSKQVTKQVANTFAEIGGYIKTWRKVYALKAAQVAERAGISLGTLHKIESGDPTVRTAAFLEVARSLGLLDKLAESLDPFNSDIGRARVNESLPRRVR